MSDIIQKDVLLGMVFILAPIGTGLIQQGNIWPGIAVCALALAAFITRVYFKLEIAGKGK